MFGRSGTNLEVPYYAVGPPDMDLEVQQYVVGLPDIDLEDQQSATEQQLEDFRVKSELLKTQKYVLRSKKQLFTVDQMISASILEVPAVVLA